MLSFFWLFTKVILAKTSLEKKYETLVDIYSTYNGIPGLDHYLLYGPWYDENIHHLRETAVQEGRKVTILEIGVQSGGSTRVWKRYFRDLLDYVGLDIDPRCRMFQSLDEGIRIVTGSQLDTTLLSKLCNEYGPFDLVIDDGGHTNEMMQTSLKSLWNCMKDDSVYAIEDLHAINMGMFGKLKEPNIFHELAEWMRERSPSIFNNQTEVKSHPGGHLKKLAFYDSLVFLHYGSKLPSLIESRIMKGLKWVEGERIGVPEPKEELSLSDWCDHCCIGCYDN